MEQTLVEQGFYVCEQMAGFSQHIGPFYEKHQDVENNHFIRALVIDGHHLNREGVVHGGVPLSFIDYVIYRAIGDRIGHQIQFATFRAC